MAKLTTLQADIVRATNKYGVVYPASNTVANNLVRKGLLTGHINFYGQTHGYKLTSSGWQAKREMKG